MKLVGITFSIKMEHNSSQTLIKSHCWVKIFYGCYLHGPRMQCVRHLRIDCGKSLVVPPPSLAQGWTDRWNRRWRTGRRYTRSPTIRVKVTHRSWPHSREL